jgi:KTSC domain
MPVKGTTNARKGVPTTAFSPQTDLRLGPKGLGRTVVMVPVKSSNVAAIGYDPSSQSLFVQFLSSGTYEYSGVSRQRHRALMKARSQGTYFHAKIRNKYTFRKLAADIPTEKAAPARG